MKIKLEKFSYKKHFFKFLFGMFKFRILKSLGFFKRRFITNLFQWIFLNCKNEAYNFAIISNNKIVGGIQLAKKFKGEYYVGVFVFKKYWNKGIATQATKRILIYAEKKKIKKVLAINDSYNVASTKIVKRLGFKKTRENKKRELFWEKKLK